MPLPSLPPEPLVVIAEQVDDRRVLRRLCLVSRSWDRAARFQLYRFVALRGRQAGRLARVLAARPDLAQAVREMEIMEIQSLDCGDGQDEQALLQGIFQRSTRIVKLAVKRFSEPLPIFVALATTPLPHLKELDVAETLDIDSGLSGFTAVLHTHPTLANLHFEGLRLDWIESAPVTELRDLQAAARRHIFTSLDVGIACPAGALNIFASHAFARLQHLRLEIHISVDAADLESLTGLQTLELYTGTHENESEFKMSVASASSEAAWILDCCSSLPALRSVMLDLNQDGDYEGAIDSFPSDHIVDKELLFSLPPTLVSLHITASLVDAETLLTYLEPTHRPPSLSFIHADIYWEKHHTSKLKRLLRRLHSLGIRYEIAPFRVEFYHWEDWDDSAVWCGEVQGAGRMWKWEGGEWSEPELESEVETESEAETESEGSAEESGRDGDDDEGSDEE